MRSLFGMRSNQVCSETLILFQLVLLYFVCSSVSAAAFSEKWVLLQFKDSVSDPSGILSGWDSDSDHCSWYGVQCGPESRVSSLIITGGGRKGNSTLPTRSSFSHLPFYGFGIRKRRSVENGSLVGNLSPLIGKLTELRVLSLPFHGFSGEIPLEIWGLGKLEVLDLEGNSLTGNLPRHFPVLRKLRVLGLGFNSIAGEIPFSLSGCVGLQVLNLAGNELNGTIPPFVGSFPDLRGLYLSFNRLTGMVPRIFGNNSQNLEHVDLSGNLLSGEIPRSFGNCRRLKTLLLFSNLFNGSIPRHLGRLRQLEVLDVSRNSLSGPIPTELGGCLPLSVFVLSDSVPAGINSSNRIKENNHFQGSIPMEITNLPMLRLLWAPRAGLEGKFPSSWGSCGSLEMVNVAQNLFTGDISGLLGGCKKLHLLNLSSNRLTGKLDEKLPVPCMIVFDVSGNLLSGSIPRFNYCKSPNMPSSNSHLGWSKNPSFAYISFYMYVTQLEISLPFSSPSVAVVHNFAENRFTGPIPWLPIAPKRLLGKQIDYVFLAGGNKLSGLFPGHLFGKCDALNGLIVNISHNKVSGQIPLEVGRLCRSLKVLDASENEVSGSIPQSIGDIGALLVLNLSGNKLQGAIPVGLSQLKNLKYLSLARNNLTCTIPSSLRQLPSLKVLELSSNLHSGDNMRRLTPFLNNRKPGKIPTRSADVMLNPKFNGSLNNLCGALLLISDLTNSSHIKRILSSSDMLGKSDESKNYAAYPSESFSKSGTSGLSSIEIASIISASAIFSVLIALAILFFYTRKWMPNSRIQVSELKEIMVFVDPGVPLTFDNIVETTGNFSAGNCIGSGGFGATYKAEISPGILVAVKRLSVGRFVQGVQQFHAEIKTLGRIRHPNLVTLVGYHASQTEMFLIYNYLPGGNLENFIQERSETAVEWSTLHKIALDIAHALAYLHDECVPRVLHRDVKPSNILLDNDLNAYLSDFGLSRLMGASETHATTGVAGTFGYVAPEYAMTCRVSEKADVYSYGVVLLELISDKKALDPSFSSHGNGFNIVSWACMLLRQGEAKDVFTPGLWDAGPHDKLVEALHLAVMCTVESLSIRPTMKQVVQRLNQLHSPSR